MVEHTSPYGIGTTVDLPYDRAVARTRDELGREGFCVLTAIDVQATFKNKLDVEFRPNVILGACNPMLAHRALSAERDIGLLLPCNVVVYQADDSKKSVVAALDPVTALRLTGNADIGPIAEEVKGRLQRVLEAVARA